MPQRAFLVEPQRSFTADARGDGHDDRPVLRVVRPLLPEPALEPATFDTFAPGMDAKHRILLRRVAAPLGWDESTPLTITEPDPGRLVVTADPGGGDRLDSQRLHLLIERNVIDLLAAEIDAPSQILGLTELDTDVALSGYQPRPLDIKTPPGGLVAGSSGSWSSEDLSAPLGRLAIGLGHRGNSWRSARPGAAGGSR